MKRLFLILSSGAFVLAAHGTTVFDTLGPSNTYDQFSAFGVGDFGTSPTYEEAAQFTAAANGNLLTVDLGLTYYPSFAPIPVNVYLYGSVGGSPGANLGFLGSATPTAAYGSTTSSVVSFAVLGTIPVTMGTSYWLVLKPAAPNGWDEWNAAAPTFSGMEDQSTDDSTWLHAYNFLPAFRLTAGPSTVPDSGATFILFFGSLAVLIVGERICARQQASR